MCAKILLTVKKRRKIKGVRNMGTLRYRTYGTWSINHDMVRHADTWVLTHGMYLRDVIHDMVWHVDSVHLLYLRYPRHGAECWQRACPGWKNRYRSALGHLVGSVVATPLHVSSGGTWKKIIINKRKLWSKPRYRLVFFSVYWLNPESRPRLFDQIYYSKIFITS
jgi:hypothetical protein